MTRAEQEDKGESGWERRGGRVFGERRGEEGEHEGYGEEEEGSSEIGERWRW